RGPRDLPTAKHLFIQAVVPSKQAMSRTDRHINHKRDDGAMSDVKRRWPTFRLHIIHVGNAGPFAGGAEERGRGVNRLAERVRTLNEDALPSLILRREHEAVVVRITAVYTRGHCREERIWENLLVRALSAAFGRIANNHPRLVLIDKRSELVTGRSLVVHLN